ncbi:hypothetical protein A2U01_0060458, partial [Trifolium medium]|nr:hypothetical protein [Trifolium medium]
REFVSYFPEGRSESFEKGEGTEKCSKLGKAKDESFSRN